MAFPPPKYISVVYENSDSPLLHGFCSTRLELLRGKLSALRRIEIERSSIRCARLGCTSLDRILARETRKPTESLRALLCSEYAGSQLTRTHAS